MKVFAKTSRQAGKISKIQDSKINVCNFNRGRTQQIPAISRCRSKPGLEDAKDRKNAGLIAKKIPRFARIPSRLPRSNRVSG